VKPQLGTSQARLVRALVALLTPESEDMLTAAREPGGFVLEAIDTVPWATLTFAGEHHRLVCHVPAGRQTTVDSDALHLPGVMVAVRSAVWRVDGSVARLTLDVLTLRDPLTNVLR